MHISIIIPAYNEATGIAGLIKYLQQHGSTVVKEIIVSDGGSTDATVQKAQHAGALVVVSPQKGRAAQMNYATAQATGDVLYFVHADTKPPESFAADILRAVQQGYGMGRYRTRFDSRSWLLKLNAWFTRFDLFICMGGDQTLFVTNALFLQTGGFKNEQLIMEEYEFCTRARKLTQYKIFRGVTLVSARKFEGRSWCQVQKANYKAVKLYKSGATSQQIAATYSAMLRIK